MSFVHIIEDFTDLAGQFWLKPNSSLQREWSGRSVPMTNRKCPYSHPLVILGGGGGRGVLKKVSYGEANFLSFYIPFFERKGISFIYLLLTNGTPFTHLVSTAANALSFKYEWITTEAPVVQMLDNAIHRPFEQPGPDIFLTLSQPYNASVGLFVPLCRPKWQISLHFHILQLIPSLPLHTPKAWKWYPVQGVRLNLSIIEGKHWKGLDTETNPIGNNTDL